MSSEKHNPHIIYRAIGTSLFSGYIPYSPGTAGSILCIVIFGLLPPLHLLSLAVIAICVFFIGLYSSSVLAREWGKDPGNINIDEVVGMMVALIGLPKLLPLWLTAFIFFRIFDIFKPPPIRLFEFLPAGWGIMMDDIIAGIYANLACWIILWIV